MVSLLIVVKKEPTITMQFLVCLSIVLAVSVSCLAVEEAVAAEPVPAGPAAAATAATVAAAPDVEMVAVPRRDKRGFLATPFVYPFAAYPSAYTAAYATYPAAYNSAYTAYPTAYHAAAPLIAAAPYKTVAAPAFGAYTYLG